MRLLAVGFVAGCTLAAVLGCIRLARVLKGTNPYSRYPSPIFS